MAILSGNEYRVHLQSATAGTFNAFAGQRGASKTSSRPTFSKASKSSTVDIQGVGTRQFTITMEGVLTLPDSNGFTRAETLYAAGTAEKIKVINGNGSGTDVFEGSVHISKLDVSPPFNGEVTYSMEFVPAADPVTDTWS